MIELSCEIHRTVRLKRGYNLDKQTFVLYNKIDSISVTTTEYLFSQIDWENGNKPDNACGTLRESTAASELLWTVGSQVSVKDSFDFEFQSRLHECEATTAGDPSILFAGSRYAFVCRLFLLPESRLQLNDRLDGIWFCQDLLCEQREWNDAAVRFRGRNRKTTFRQTGEKRRENVSIGITSIGFWYQNPSTA